MATFPVESCVAVPLVRVNGQLTPPWLTSPLADQLSVEPEIEPVPAPLTLMLPPHVAVNETVAVDELAGVTVYWTLPQPVAGVEALTDDQVPAKVSIPTVGDGDVGVEDERVLLIELIEQRTARGHQTGAGDRKEGPNSPH